MSTYKISIQELSDKDFACLEECGHLGTKTRDIAELQYFYFAIEDERKRRNLKLIELQKKLPINKFFRVNTDSGSYVYKVMNCTAAPKDWHITHFTEIEGIKIKDNKLAYYKNNTNENWQIDESIEFGWNANSQEMLFWVKGNDAPYETIEIDENYYNQLMQTFENIGFDI